MAEYLYIQCTHIWISRKESFTKLQLKSLIIHIDFSNQLMWLWIVINSGEYSSCSSIQIYHF